MPYVIISSGENVTYETYEIARRFSLLASPLIVRNAVRNRANVNDFAPVRSR